jgi:hypothetical protein
MGCPWIPFDCVSDKVNERPGREKIGDIKIVKVNVADEPAFVVREHAE